VVVIAFFLAHWALAVFMQSFFLHRYGAHKMFTMHKAWERTFHLLTFVCLGSSYLQARGYAILHRMHHAFSDSARDPHSPSNHRGPAALLTMMWQTKLKYDAVSYGGPSPEARFDGDVPTWPALDRIAQSWSVRIGWGVAYTLFYLAFATAWWQFLLLPIHYVMGPVHGAIVNWCGHMYGYRIHRTSDGSRNTLPIDVLCAGELFQNNHHYRPRNANFASRWFEIDPTYQVIRVLVALGVVRLAVRPT
jgi:stearoyl-CoA desaturase (Delta-9 desaturase)